MDEEALRARLLGPMDLRFGKRQLPPLDSARAESLLAYLLLHRDVPQPRQRLAFLLWPDSAEGQAHTNLRKVLHTLRRALPDADRLIEVGPRTLRWRPDAPLWLDVEQFERAVAGGRLKEAVRLYAGELLEGRYDEWLADERERLAGLHADALERLARRRTGTAGFVIPIAGGVASLAGEGSPYNKVAGLGFGGVPDASSLDEIERAFAACGAPVQVELAHLADPAIAALLSARGYQLESFENVLGRALADDLERVMPPGIEVRLTGEQESETWLDVVAEGSVHPDTQGVPWHEEFSREAIIGAERDSAVAGDVRYAALRDGVIARGATMRIAEGIAQLTGAATVPAHRRRGVQTALLSARLADAAAAGCDIAVITTQPGSKSQQNAQRQGFDLLYARAVLVKQP
jgi:ribosomal protein S18 acetylase RimI-like enzyme